MRDAALVYSRGYVNLENAPALAALPVAGPLSPAAETDTFSSNAGFLRFTRNSSGPVNDFNLSTNGQVGYRFDRDRSGSIGAAAEKCCLRSAAARP